LGRARALDGQDSQPFLPMPVAVKYDKKARSEHCAMPDPSEPTAREPERRQTAVAEVCFFYGAILGIAVLPDFGMQWGALRFDRSLVLTATLIYLPLIPYAQGRLSLADLGLGKKGFGASLALAAVAGLVCFGVFVLIWRLAGGPMLGLPPFSPDWSRMGAAAWAQKSAAQFLAVAIPEEWFFRGYLQPRLAFLWPAAWGRGRARISLAAVLSAAFFALAHAARYHSPLSLNVFFPGLLFAWAREQEGHLAGPALLHAAANLLLFSLAAPRG